MKILIVHPEGNITNNPHLLGVLGLFVERRVAVDVLIPNRPDIEAGSLFPGCTVLKAPVTPRAYLDHTLLLRGAGPEDIDHRVASFCEWRNDYEFIVGIDRGIIEAAMN